MFDTHLKISDQNLNLNLWSWISRDSGIGAGAAQALDARGGDDNDLFLADISYRIGDGKNVLDTEFRASYLYYDTQASFNILPAGSIVPIGSDGNINFNEPVGLVEFSDGLKGKPGGRTDDYILEFVSIFSGLESHKWRLAVGTKYQKLKTREEKNFGPSVINGTEGVVDGVLTDVSNSEFVFVKDRSRSIKYVSIQDVWHLTHGLELTAGIRVDDYSDFGTTKNPRIAFVWSGSENINTKFLYGHAFRAPSFSEKFMEHNPIAHGNAELKPEEIDTYELSVQWQRKETFESTISIFKYKAIGLVEYMPDSDESIRKAKNARNQKGRGVELEMSWHVNPAFSIDSSFALQDSKNETTNEEVHDAPGRHYTVALNWAPSSSLFANIRLNRVEDRVRVTGDLRPNVGNYTLVDLTLGYEKNAWDISVGVGNATQEDAREPSTETIPEDYPLPSRNYWLAFTYAF